MELLPRNLAPKLDNNGLSPITVDLLITLLVLVVVAMVLTVSLLGLKRYRRSKKALLPTHNAECPRRQKHQRTPSGYSVAIPPAGHSKSVFVYDEKQELANRSSSPPPESLPEIRITFPEEVDDSGKRMSGRMVVVRVGERGLGMEPVEENLPPYQTNASERFQSLDLDRIGGLKEKDERR